MKRTDAIIATRAFLRGALTASSRMNTQLINAALSHAGGDYGPTGDALAAAMHHHTQMGTLLAQARATLAHEAQQPDASEAVAA